MTLTIVETRAVTGGVDTHADVHVPAALDPIGGLLGVRAAGLRSRRLGIWRSPVRVARPPIPASM
jgi:hypothetical protein